METTTQIENSNASKHGVAGPGFQKRIDRLIREKYELRQENDQLRTDNAELQALVLEYEKTLEKYRATLRSARRKLNGEQFSARG